MRPTARMRPPLIPIALAAAIALAPAVRGDEPAFSPPIGAQGAASGEASLATPTRLGIPAGERKGTAMGTVAAGRRATFLFVPPPGAMFSLGVSSKSGEARLSIFEPGSETPLAGTAESDGAIRWIGSVAKEGDYRIVVHTRGEETPIRLEATVEREAGSADGTE